MNTELLIQELCQQGYHVVDDLLPTQHCQSLRAVAESQYQQGQFRGAKIGRTIDSHQNDAIRTDQILWLEGNESEPCIQFFLQQIEQLAQTLNQQLFLGLNEFETHFANYQPGTYYKMHIDQFASQKTRKISFVYYLNQDWQKDYGGVLKLYAKDGELIQEVLPYENRLICFNSELPHEVTCTQKPRYSITGWMKTRSEVLV